MKRLARDLLSRMPQLTVDRSAAASLDNAARNAPFIERSILEIEADANPAALVVSAGPSLHRRDPAPAVLDGDFRGTLIAVDGALGYCLRNGLVPDYVVVLDPHSSRVCRWFGDPDLEFRDDDDYFRRQDLDPYLGLKEKKRNRELIDLVNEHGPKMAAIICTSVAPNVTRRCLDAALQLYWWNPLLDDVANPDSLTRRLHRANRLPAMVSGGNVGTAAWVFAHQVLRKQMVGLVGMDLSYAPGTPLRNTQYYSEMEALFGDEAASAYIDVDNPHTGERWFADPTYYWYRDVFLQMARDAGCVTYNCTEGGIVFGDGVRFVPLAEFLQLVAGRG